MKINEVVLEAGVLRSVGNYLAPGVVTAYDKLKGGLSGMKSGGPGFKAGAQAAVAGSTQQKQIEQVAKTALQKWAAYEQTLKAAGGTPTTKDAVEWFASWAKMPVNTVEEPAGISLGQLNPWLTKQIANYLAKKQLGQIPSPTQTAAPSIGALGKRGSAAPAPSALAQQPAATTADDIAKQVEIVQQEPITLRYKNKDYGLNDQGQWAPFGTNRPLSQAAQALFDKVAGFNK